MTRPSNDKMFNEHHTHSQKDGYQPAEYEHQEYPKVIGTDDAGNDVIAQSAEHEAELLAEKDSE